MVAGIFISARRPPKKPPEERFHPTKLWKSPYETTRLGLWLRAAFVSVAGFVGLNVVMFGVRLIDGGEISYFSAYSVQFLAFVPLIYWRTRRQYFPVSPAVKGGAMKDHRGGEKLYHLAPLCSINVRANC